MWWEEAHTPRSAGGVGERRPGSPARIDHFDLGRDIIKGGEKTLQLFQAAAELLPWLFGPHVAGYHSKFKMTHTTECMTEAVENPYARGDDSPPAP